MSTSHNSLSCSTYRTWYLMHSNHKLRSCRLRCLAANNSREPTAPAVTAMRILGKGHSTPANAETQQYYQLQQHHNKQHYQQQQQQHHTQPFQPVNPFTASIGSISEHISIITASPHITHYSQGLYAPLQQQRQQHERLTAAAAAPTKIPSPLPGLAAIMSVIQGHAAVLQVHLPFAAFFGYLGVMAAAASSSDWYLDISCFGAIWAGLWAICARWHPSPRTVILLNLLPLLHLTGALGTYHWELGNLSWDILVHVSNGFIGTLLFAAVMTDVSDTHLFKQQQQQQRSAASSSSNSSTITVGVSSKGDHHNNSRTSVKTANIPNAVKSSAWRFLQLSMMLIIGTSLIEVVEGLGGVVAGPGEGIFLRGAGDFCTASVPCSEEVDTAKDMVDNVAGMMMALVALGTSGVSRSSTAAAAAAANDVDAC